jgi:hypothetical protein
VNAAAVLLRHSAHSRVCDACPTTMTAGSRTDGVVDNPSVTLTSDRKMETVTHDNDEMHY